MSDSVKLNMQTKQTIRALGKRGNQLQIAAAETVNDAGEGLQETYKRKIKKKLTVRTKFTTNAVKMYKAKPVRTSGEPRPLHNINSKVFVPKMRGGKEHYLSKQERRAKPSKNRKTKNRVPIPLDMARTSGQFGKSIASANRLTNAEPQTLKTAGGRSNRGKDR